MTLNNALTTHLNNLGSIPLLAPHEEQALTRTIHHGQELQKKLEQNTIPAEKHDMAKTFIEQAETARQELINANLRLVVNIAKRYYGQSHDLNDLIQEGTLGLIRATELFNPDSGNKFSTYATNWVKQRILLAIQNHDKLIRQTPHITQQIRQVNQAHSDLTLQHGVEPTPEEIAIHLGPKWTPTQVEETMTYASMHVSSLDAIPEHSDDSDNLSLHEATPDNKLPTAHDHAEINQRNEKLYEALTQLNEAETMLLKLHYGLGNSPTFDIKEAGITLGILNPNDAKTMHRAILKKLRVTNKHLHELTRN